MMPNNIFNTKDIEEFVHEHIQQKIDNNELRLIGFDMEHEDNFKREFEIYQNALFEGIVNGIVMCGGRIQGIDI